MFWDDKYGTQGLPQEVSIINLLIPLMNFSFAYTNQKKRKAQILSVG